MTLSGLEVRHILIIGLKNLLLLVTVVYGLLVLLLTLFALSDSESSWANILLRIAVLFVPSPLLIFAWRWLGRMSLRLKGSQP